MSAKTKGVLWIILGVIAGAAVGGLGAVWICSALKLQGVLRPYM